MHDFLFRNLLRLLPAEFRGLVVAALDSLLYGVRPLDPATFAGASVALSLAALAACSLPASRAASTDPVTTLRAE